MINNKDLTKERKIIYAPLPKKVVIPLIQHAGAQPALLVKPGDTVRVGTKLAQPEKFISAPVHSSISGRVTRIENFIHPVLNKCLGVEIEGDSNDTLEPSIKPNPDPQNLTSEQILEIISNSGIVGLGGAAFPTYVKLFVSRQKKVSTLIVNGAECEPYLTGDYRLMLEKTNEIFLGIDIIAKCLDITNVYIAVEENKQEAIDKFKLQILNPKSETNPKSPASPAGRQIPNYRLQILKSRYPQGGERQLIKTILRKEVPRGKLPLDIGVLVHNVGTIFAIYEAVYFNKPLYERVVTVTGDCLSEPSNLRARIGTPIKELIDFCGPLKEEPAKIIIGGPMMGIAQFTDEAPIIKSTTGILLLTEKEAKKQEEKFCIRCGACVRECPAYLMPTLINLASKKQFWQKANVYGAMDCIECGLCDYVCPSNIRLLQSIKRAKLEMAK